MHCLPMSHKKNARLKWVDMAVRTKISRSGPFSFWHETSRPAHENLVLIAYAPPTTKKKQKNKKKNAHADVSSLVKSLKFNLGLHLHPYFVHASSEGAFESVLMRRLNRAFVVRQCGKYQNLMCWPINVFFFLRRSNNSIINARFIGNLCFFFRFRLHFFSNFLIKCTLCNIE